MRWFPGTLTLTWVTLTLELATSRASARRHATGPAAAVREPPNG